jgi:hypothetical protein
MNTLQNKKLTLTLKVEKNPRLNKVHISKEVVKIQKDKDRVTVNYLKNKEIASEQNH